jgi:hypothetical protein
MPRGGKRTRVVAMLGLVALMVPLLLLGCTPGTSESAATGDGASGGGATTAAVDASGAYRSGIAFEVPPFHGIEPSLRLTYDSSDGQAP